MVVETMKKEHLSIYAAMQEFGINDHKIIERWERIYLDRKMTRITRLTQRLTQHRVQRHKGYRQCSYRKTALSNCQNRQGV